MRRHTSYFWLGTTDPDDDPNDDLWELHRKYNLMDSNPKPKKPPSPGLCTKTKQIVVRSCRSIANLKLSSM